MITSIVINHSYSDRRVRVDVPIQVSYQSDVELALRSDDGGGQRDTRE